MSVTDAGWRRAKLKKTGCDGSCTTCVGSSTSCTQCPPPTFASNGQCVNLCPATSVPSNGTCIPCSPDCTTCSSPSSSSCLSCPRERPVLSGGRCVEYCPKDQFYDPTATSCAKCDPACASCLGATSSDCSSCADGFSLVSGRCVVAQCKKGIVPDLGLCLEDLIARRSRRPFLAFLAVIVVIAMVGGTIHWYIRRERRKTRLATREFAKAMDERDVRDRMLILRLERVLGLDRVRQPKDIPRLAEEGERKERDRLRLRELLMLSKRNRGAAQHGDVDSGEGILLPDRHGGDCFEGASTQPPAEHSEQKGDGGRTTRVSHWFAPPPPYAESSSSSYTTPTRSHNSDKSVDTVSKPTFLQGTSTTIISMSSPISPCYAPPTLPPPLRPLAVGATARLVQVPLGQGAGDGRDTREAHRRASLKRLWPAMPSPVFGPNPAGSRSGEGWV